MIKAILLDMYGVIIKQTGDDFVPYIHRTHPELTAEQIQSPWFRANAGEVTSLDTGASSASRKIRKNWRRNIWIRSN